MSSQGQLICKYCSKGFKANQYLIKHLQQNKVCNGKWQADQGISIGFNPIGRRETRSRSKAAAAASVDAAGNDSSRLLATGVAAMPRQEGGTLGSGREAIPQALLDEDSIVRELQQGGVSSENEEDDRKMPARSSIDNVEEADEEASMDDELHGTSVLDSFDADDNISQGEMSIDDEGSVEPITNDGHPNPEASGPPDDRNIKSFRDYCIKNERRGDLSAQQERSIKLLDILRKKKAPMNAYDDLLGWYLEETGKKAPKEPLGQCSDYISRKVMIKFLKERYNMKDDKMPFFKEIVLPHSNARIKVICFDARNCVEQLLTDPRLTDDDFSFYDDNPLAPPPHTRRYIGEMNTGDAYRNGYAAYVKKDNQMGIGIQWYIDGAATGQFQNLSITALKMSLSCFTLDYRKKDSAWAILGFVVNYSESKSRGKKLFSDSQHDQAMEEVEGTFMSNEGEEEKKKVPKAQDFHKQLATILQTYISLQAKGMIFDLHYHGKLYRNVEFVFWTVMVKADTLEADQLCGQYTARTKVKMLCRYCTCPLEEGDRIHVNYEPKTISMLMDLIADKDLDGLKAISQQYIDNAWYKVRFDPTNGTGIHGACPSEMLHAIYLGIFMYLRECFFDQIGPTGALSKLIEGLAEQYGLLYPHNSEGDLPNCRFTHGIRGKRKLMAMEYRGVLLLIASVLRSTKGRELLRESEHFRNPAHVKDWLMLVESLLQWDAYLCESKMRVTDVKKLEHKNRFIMYLFRKVARRTKAMGLKIMKYHAIHHMASDILLYGVPKEHDTGANESGHKVTKVAARLTQKNLETFEYQTANRLMEFLLIQWGMAELEGRKLWKYYGQFDPSPPKNDDMHSQSTTGDSESSSPPPRKRSKTQSKAVLDNENNTITTGTRLEVLWLGEEDPYMGIKRRNNRRNPTAVDLDRTAQYKSEDLVYFLLGLQDLMEEVTNQDDFELPIYTEHKRSGKIFRGHPNYRQGGYWRDWVMIDWGLDEDLPAQIWCFVTLSGIPHDRDEEYGGVQLENLTYAVVEAATWDEDEEQIKMSDIFTPLIKEVAKFDRRTGKVLKRRFYLADVDAIAAPMNVVPDIGAKPACRYFQVHPRSKWVEQFVDWLRDDPNLDQMSADEQ
jgi:hypothetical protein